MFSLGLLIAFFLPWIDLILIRLSGFRIPIAYDRLSSLGSLFGNDMLYVRLSYLLFLIPICVIYNTLVDLKLLGSKKKYFLNEFVVGLILSGTVFILAVTTEFNLAIFGIGFWLTLLFSILGVTVDWNRLQKTVPLGTVFVNNSTKHNTSLPPTQSHDFRLKAIRNLKAMGEPFDEYDVELEMDKLQKEYNEQQNDKRKREEGEELLEKERQAAKEKTKKIAIGIIVLLAVIIFFRFCAHLPSRNENTAFTEQTTRALNIPFTKHGELVFISSITADTLALIDIELADTDVLRARGLMFRESMPEYAGMLFLMDFEEIQGFWMRNTYISLDMLFVNAEREIVTIHANTTILSERTYFSTQPALYVVEVNAGFSYRNNINVGDFIDFIID